MKNTKLKLNGIKVKSFITKSENIDVKTILGGRPPKIADAPETTPNVNCKYNYSEFCATVLC